MSRRLGIEPPIGLIPAQLEPDAAPQQPCCGTYYRLTTSSVSSRLSLQGFSTVLSLRWVQSRIVANPAPCRRR